MYYDPGTTDKLPKEYSTQRGTPPVLCFGQELTEEKFIESFGVKVLEPTQVVLVRTEEKKRQLSKTFRRPEEHRSLDSVMTIAEAKGREFEDLLMYDCLSWTSNPCWYT